MRGIPHENLLEKAKHEIREKETNRHTDQAAHAQENMITIAMDRKIDELLAVTESDPRNYHEAMQAYDAAEWEISYNDEMDSMRRHGVWMLVPRSSIPSGR